MQRRLLGHPVCIRVDVELARAAVAAADHFFRVHSFFNQAKGFGVQYLPIGPHKE
jgi:hypothetical protein